MQTPPRVGSVSAKLNLRLNLVRNQNQIFMQKFKSPLVIEQSVLSSILAAPPA